MNLMLSSVGRMRMKVDLSYPSSALISVMKNPEQIITLDANFFISPDRRPIARSGIKFEQFKEIWLDPIFLAFPKLAIHEAVYEELVGISSQSFVDEKRESNPFKMVFHSDSSLTEVESNLRDTIESKISSHTKYDPILNNKDDRGEVKSLSYIAVKGLLYFAANDHNAIQLIEKSEEWSTGLDNVQAIKMYELIYFLQRSGLADKTGMKMFYKYQYYLTEREKSKNPSWGNFTIGMDKLYNPYFN